jgi:hypothetical protein
VASNEGVQGLLKWQTLKLSKLAQLDKVLYKWFTAMCSEGKPVTGAMITEKAMSFYDEMKITDKCAFSYSGLQNIGIVQNMTI